MRRMGKSQLFYMVGFFEKIVEQLRNGILAANKHTEDMGIRVSIQKLTRGTSGKFRKKIIIKISRKRLKT